MTYQILTYQKTAKNDKDSLTYSHSHCVYMILFHICQGFFIWIGGCLTVISINMVVNYFKRLPHSQS